MHSGTFQEIWRSSQQLQARASCHKTPKKALWSLAGFLMIYCCIKNLVVKMVTILFVHNFVGQKFVLSGSSADLTHSAKGHSLQIPSSGGHKGCTVQGSLTQRSGGCWWLWLGLCLPLGLSSSRRLAGAFLRGEGGIPGGQEQKL